LYSAFPLQLGFPASGHRFGIMWSAVPPQASPKVNILCHFATYQRMLAAQSIGQKLISSLPFMICFVEIELINFSVAGSRGRIHKKNGTNKLECLSLESKSSLL